MTRPVASRSVALLMLVPLVLAGCGGGSGKSIATPSSAVTSSPAVTETPATTPTPARTFTPGPTPRPATRIELSADPQQLICDGARPSTVTARVLDDAGQPVADGTAVTFSVRAFGVADPIKTQTAGGVATTSVTARGQGVGVAVNVTSGDAAAAVRIDCE